MSDNDENKAILKGLAITVAGIILLAATIGGSVCLNDYIFVHNGYTLSTLPGAQGTQWVKAPK